MKDNKSTRNYDAENKDVASICFNCPYDNCIEDKYKGFKGYSHCERYTEEYRKLQEKYGVKRVGCPLHYETEEKYD